MSQLTLYNGDLTRLHEHALVHPKDFTKNPALDYIGRAMRDFCPIEGTKWRKLMTVLVQPGNHIPTHEHQGYTIMFYPHLCEPLVAAGTFIYPEPGDLLRIPPGVPHSVPRVTQQRLSVAMVIDNRA